MRALRSLASFLTPKKLLTVNILNKERKAYEYFTLLRKKKDLSRAELQERLRFTSKNKGASLSRLNDATLDTLVNTALVIHTDSRFPKRVGMYRKLKKRQALLEILIYEHEIETAIPLAEENITKAIDYEFNDIVCVFAQWLQHYYSVVKFSKAKYQRYKQIYHSSKEKIQAEEHMYLLCCEYAAEFNTSSARRIERIAKEIDMILNNRRKSYKSCHLGYSILSVYYLTVGDNPKVIATCIDAISYFKENNKRGNTPLFSFNYRLIPLYVIAADYPKAVSCMNECLDLVDPKSYNYFLAKRYSIVIALHQREYDLACRLAEGENADDMDGKLGELWKILNAYAYLMTFQHNKVKLGKLLNELFSLQGDKTAYNVNNLIIELLFRLKREEHDTLIDRMPAVERYIHRYLKDDKSVRPRIYLNMIIDGVKSGFETLDPQTYIRELNKHPKDKTKQDVDLEMVPFEDLVKLTLC